MRYVSSRMVLLVLLSALFPPQSALCDESAKPEPRKTEEKQLYDDGSLHFTAPLDAKGLRNGQYTAWFPGDQKKVQERVKYEHGERSGSRELFNEAGDLIGEEGWVHGKLVFPKSQRMIEQARKRLSAEAVDFVEKMPDLSNPNAPSSVQLAGALGQLNAYRYLCDLPADVVLDNEYINRCQFAAELLTTVGHLTHTPEKPQGFNQRAYEIGRGGCAHSNLNMGGDIIASVSAYMNDSDSSNIDRLGHRRWILHPEMGRTGFGMNGQMSAMYSMDDSRKDPPDYDFVCFPPRGWCPMDMFGPKWAWHVSMNPAKFRVDDKAILEIYPVDRALHRAAKPVERRYAHLDRGEYGINNAVIIRPAVDAVRTSVVYEVVVKGVKTRNDEKPVDISYYVSFYEPPAR